MKRAQILKSILEAVQKTPYWSLMTEGERIGVLGHIVNRSLNRAVR